MSYQIIEKEDGFNYLFFEGKEYWIRDQQGKLLKVLDETIEGGLNTNVFNLETEEFFFKEWVYNCWFEDFGIGIWKDAKLISKPNLFSYEARCKVFKKDMI